MAWLPASLLKHTDAYRHARQRCAYASFMKEDGNIGELRHGLATLNSNNSVVYGQRHKVWIHVFLERAKHFETKIEQIW